AAEITEIPFGTAKKIWAKYQKTGSTSNQPWKGRPTKVTEQTGRQIVHKVLQDHHKPLQCIGNKLKRRLGATAVCEHLASKGYCRRVARKVPYLTKDQKMKREAWAEYVKGIDWSKVIWSDECYVYLSNTHGRIYVTRCDNSKYDEDCLIPPFKQSSICVMVWACIIKRKKGPLVVLKYPGGKG
ncbi:hypothetical protein BDP27DRAFT_1204029, partial [Rhodocollybia butyracea]